MYQRKPRRFRRRSNGRGHMSRGDNNHQGRLRTNSFLEMPKNNLRPSLGADKLFEKYTALAKEALSSGDKALSENYLQHADHFTRIMNEQENLRKERFAENKPTNSENSLEEKPTKMDGISKDGVVKDEAIKEEIVKKVKEVAEVKKTAKAQIKVS